MEVTLREAYFFVGDLMERAYSWHINSRVLGFDVSEFEGKCEGLLRLLNAQEPRVMTLEEYEAWIDTPFTERNPVFHEERTKRGTVTCWVNTVVCTLREYGKNDRCWTSRPTAAEMEAKPWN